MNPELGLWGGGREREREAGKERKEGGEGRRGKEGEGHEERNGSRFLCFYLQLVLLQRYMCRGTVAGCAVQEATHVHSAGVRASEQLDNFRHWNSWYRMDVELARTPPAPSPDVWLPLLQLLVEELE